MKCEAERQSGYYSWKAMNARCKNRNHKDNERYAGRGIQVCEEWRGRGGYKRFIASVGERPSPSHQIDRINNDGNYEPGNVRWVTAKQNLRNRGAYNRVLTCRGESRTLAEWAELVGRSEQTIRARLELGWTIENAIFRATRPMSPRQVQTGRQSSRQV